MKKEIIGYVPKHLAGNDQFFDFYSEKGFREERINDCYKAKLIIDIPRKKMLTEDEVRDAISSQWASELVKNGIIEKLFGEDTDAN